MRTLPTRKPRQQPLPGTEDSVIQALETLAADYVDVRDSRMDIGKQEAALKQELLALMKKHGKERYHRDGITITVIREAEKVEVRVKKADENEGDEIDVETDAAAEQGAA